MEHEIVRITFASSLTEICEANSSFDKGVLRVAYTGQNRNKTFISKDAFERALPSIYNCPIVANYSVEENSIGGHDVGVVKNNEGALRLINYTEPLGVVPESAAAYFDTVEEADGTLREYFCVDVLIWKRQPVYSKLKEDGITSHSMEISVKEGHTEDGIFHIDSFEFNAFCLLGDNVEPCFESSSLEVYSLDFKKQMSEMMQDLKNSLQVETSNDVHDIHPQKYSTEGGNKVLDEKMKIVAEYGIDIDSLDFSIDDLTEEELIEKFEAMKEADNGNDNVDPSSAPADENFALTEQIVDEILRQLRSETIATAWGDESRYCYIDCDLDANEVYAYDISDWLVYGFSYTKDGDSIAIDFESKKRKKFAIVDFDEGEDIAPMAPLFAHAEQAVKDNAEWEEKYNTASEAMTSMEEELNELRQYKADVEAASELAKREEIFAKFEDLDGIEAFEKLREDNSEIDIETLEEKLFAIRGRLGASAKFSLDENKAPKLKVAKSDTPKEPYGGIVEEYLGKNE